MAKLENCSICGEPVLELEGQFELLASYLPGLDDDALTLSGEVHTSCLIASPMRAAWALAKIDYLQSTQGLALLSQQHGWTILFHSRLRELVAVHDDGVSVEIAGNGAPCTPCEGGGRIKVECDAHFSFSDRAFVSTVQTELTSKKRVPLSLFVDELGIRDRLHWPDVLKTGYFEFSRQLRRDWSAVQISGRLSFHRFVPEPVFQAFKQISSQ